MNKFTDYVNLKMKKPEPVSVINKIEETTEQIVHISIPVSDIKIEPPKEPTETEQTIHETEQITEKTEFEDLDLTESELLAIKKLALKDILEEELSLSELIDLVLLAKTSKPVKAKNFENLVIREYIESDGKITKTGRMYLEFPETKERLRKVIK